MIGIVLPDEPMPDPATATDLARVLISALIWVPYMLVSRRQPALEVYRSGQQLEYHPDSPLQHDLPGHVTLGRLHIRHRPHRPHARHRPR